MYVLVFVSPSMDLTGCQCQVASAQVTTNVCHAEVIPRVILHNRPATSIILIRQLQGQLTLQTVDVGDP